jgi:hypothetical protein
MTLRVQHVLASVCVVEGLIMRPEGDQSKLTQLIHRVCMPCLLEYCYNFTSSAACQLHRLQRFMQRHVAAGTCSSSAVVQASPVTILSRHVISYAFCGVAPSQL